ncbi:MAG: hypothetical protein ABSC17_05075 [Thermacetogeniaceae bacterium]
MIAPEAIQIVDLHHVKEHLSQLANTIFGIDTDLSKQWALDRHHELESGGLDIISVLPVARGLQILTRQLLLWQFQ